MTSLASKALTGIKWSAASQLVGQVVQYGSLVLLARWLEPGQFGLVATAMLVVNVLALLDELGMGAALIQRAELRQGHQNAAFVTTLGLGLLMGAGVYAAAGPLAHFFQAPAAADVLRLMAVSFPFLALATVPKALMERQLRFKALGVIDAATAMATALMACGLAWVGVGAQSLAMGTLLGYAVQASLLWRLAGWRPGVGFERRDLQELLGFGLNVLGARCVGSYSANIDNAIVGHVLGPVALGAYSLAYKLAMWPMVKISHVALRVLFPTFARYQEDDASLRRHYLRVVGTLALLAYPVLAAAAMLAPAALPYVFGHAWATAVAPFQLLCLAGAVKATVCSVGTLYGAKGRPDLEFMTNVVGAGVMTGALLLGVRGGTTGVAAAVSVVTLLGGPWQQHLANRLIQLPARAYARVLALPAAGAAVAALGAAGIARLPLPGWAVIGLGGVWLAAVLGVAWALARLEPSSELARKVAIVRLRSRRRGLKDRQAS